MSPRPHERSTEMFTGLARSFRVDVEPFDKDKWSAAITLAKALDNLVDDDHIYDSGQYLERVIQGKSIPYLTEEAIEFIQSTYDMLSEQSREQWQRSAAQLGAFALKRLEAADVHDYLHVVCEESTLMTDVLTVENNDQRDDQQQRESYNIWLEQAVRAMFVLDTCSDFVKDHNEGNMNVPITMRAVSVLARNALSEFADLARVTPASVYPLLARRTITKTLEKTSQPGFWSNQFVWK